MTYKQRVRAGIIRRLKHIQPYIDRWHEAMAWMCHPANIAFANKVLNDFATQVLQVAEDESVNVSTDNADGLVLQKS